MSSKLESTARYEAGVPAFLKRQWFVHPKPIDPASLRLAERGAIITGANGGLGLEVARQLCGLGIEYLVLTARSQSKGEAAISKLSAEFKNVVFELEILDMNSYDSIIAFAERCKGKQRRLDMALLNAGIQMDTFEKNASTGHETDVQVNYLSTVLLSILLLPTLKKNKIPDGPTPVLSLVTSDTAYFATIKDANAPVLAAFDDPANFSRMASYSGSKLLAIMFCETVAGKVSSGDVLINASNPGLTKGTALTANGGAIIKVAGVVTKAVARSTETGANALVDALIVQGTARHGSYLSDWTEKP